MATIGQLVTFCEFITKYDVEIPRIQRDYTYGSGTEKTEEVLGKLLSDIYRAITDPSKELILDFVYGNRNSGNNFQPLDGQQRLTTLFLLHLYASWGDASGMPALRFSYSTRDNTAAFCDAITNRSKFTYAFIGDTIDEQIKDCAFWRASFNDDPSIRSMLKVLVDIEERFKSLCETGELTRALVSDCRIRFYCLDFGEFGLSDDLYIKMNSRGRGLTEYEIFKSQLEKYIDITLGEKELKYDFAQKLDTDYTDLVWRELGKKREVIDDAFVMLFRNILAIRNFTRGKNTSYLQELNVLGDYLPLDSNEDRKKTPSWFIQKEDIDFIMDFLQVFNVDNDKVWGRLFYESDSVCGEFPPEGRGERIRLFRTPVNLFRTACSKKLNNAERVMMYAEYYALKRYGGGESEVDMDSWLTTMTPMRHVRNLVENSDDELARPDFLYEILKEVENVIDGNILELEKSRFNTSQFIEEKSKAANPELWKQLFHYENHDILRGALALMSEDKTVEPFRPSDFNIADSSVFKLLLYRVEKIERFFDDSLKTQDRFIRAALLSISDFGQIYSSNVKYSRNNRMIGNLPGSWRLLMTKNLRFKQSGILAVIDELDETRDLTIRDLAKNDWRYYATRDGYYQNTYLAYNAPSYGYYYTKDNSRPMEVYVLRSSSSSDDNVMWKLLNLQLMYKLTAENVVERQTLDLGNRQTAPSLKIKDKFSIDGIEEGWTIDQDAFDADVKSRLEDLGYTIRNKIVIVPDDTDYVDFGVKLVKDILSILSM